MRTSASPYAFRSYDHWQSKPLVINERNPGSAHNLPIWEVVCASMAMPSYLDPIVISGATFGGWAFGNDAVGGATFENNYVAEELRSEVSFIQGNNMDDVGLLLSLGCGKYPPIAPIAPIAPVGGTRRTQAATKYVQTAKYLASKSEQGHERLMGWKEERQLPYHRLDVPTGYGMEKLTKLYHWKKPGRFQQQDTIARITAATESYCNQPEVQTELNELADILIAARRDRRKADRVAGITRGVQYRCTIKKCNWANELLPRADDLIHHLESKHSVPADELKEWVLGGVFPPADIDR